MKHYDIIVIGMGLAGLMAAKTAAEEGRRVLLIGKGVGTAHTYTGCIDLLGYYPSGSSVPTETPFQSLGQLFEENPEHPYTLVGESEIRNSLTSFLGVFEEGNYRYLSQGEKNTIILTPSGHTRATYLYPSTMEWGGIDDERDLLIVGFHGLKDFYSAYIAHTLNLLGKQGRLSCSARFISLPLSELSRRKTAPSSVIARLFEEEEYRDKVAEAVRAERKGEERVAFPAVLGVEKPGEMRRDLEAKLGTTVFEIPTLPPSVPGFRIFQAFKRHLQRKEVTLIMGFSVAQAMARDGNCLQVTVISPPVERTYSADVYILATGSFFGGGLEAERNRVLEPIFNLPVYQPASREHWFKDRFFSDETHPIRSAGIMVNERMNPVDNGGKVVVRNLHAAGSIISHCDPHGEKSGSGIAIATGYKSARGEVR
jgi:glycerol-3-phosphate dehydrogenase subunit B